MALKYREILASGGADIAYVLHIAGYPWAVTTHEEIIPLLNELYDDESDYTLAAYAARMQMFGKTQFDIGATTWTPAMDIPVFPVLDFDSLGPQDWRIKEQTGEITGGDWSAKIFDIDLGQTWDHADSSDEFRGLEGLHRVASLFRSDSGIGWGHLTSDLLANNPSARPTTFSVEDRSIGGLLESRIEALTGDNYLTLWIGQEAIGVTSVDDTDSPDLVVTIADTGEARGLYRSRPQDHFVDNISDVNPIVSTVPPSVEGGYATLWAVPLRQNRSAFYWRADDVDVLEDHDGDMNDAGTAEWTLSDAGGKTSGGVGGAGNVLYLYHTGGAGPAYADQSPRLTVGQWYHVYGYVKKTSVSGSIRINLGNNYEVISYSAGTWAFVDYFDKCTTTQKFRLYASDTSTYDRLYCDEFRVVEEHDDPMIIRERDGPVKPTTARTSKGVTSISIASPLVCLKDDVNTSAAKSTHLARYMFSRNSGSTSMPAAIESYFQCPHLLIHERVLCKLDSAVDVSDTTLTFDTDYAFEIFEGDVIEFIYGDVDASNYDYESRGERCLVESYNSATETITITEGLSWKHGNGPKGTRFYVWHTFPIWICEPGEVCTFSTAEELIEAINWELHYCQQGSDSQKSGADTGSSPLVNMHYAYHIPARGGYLVQKDLESGELVSESKNRSFINGPLAFLLTLGVPVTGNDQNCYTKQEHGFSDSGDYLKEMAKGKNWFDYIDGKMRSWIFAQKDQGTSGSSNCWLRIPEPDQVYRGLLPQPNGFMPYSPENATEEMQSSASIDLHSKNIDWSQNMAQYILQFDWDYDTDWNVPNFVPTVESTQTIPYWSSTTIYRYTLPWSPGNSNKFAIPQDPDKTDNILWLREEDDYTVYKNGEALYLGSRTNKRGATLTGTLDSTPANYDSTLGYPYLIPDAAYLDVEDYWGDDKMPIGTTLFYLPLLDSKDPSAPDFARDDPYSVSVKYYYTIQDERWWRMVQALFYSQDVTDITVAARIRNSWCPYFHTGDASYNWGDHISLISWDTYNDVCSPVVSGQKYRVVLNDEFVSIYDVLCQEILLHGLRWTMFLDETDSSVIMWRFGVTPIGEPNVTDATYRGRSIGAEFLPEPHDVVLSKDGLVNKVRVRANATDSGSFDFNMLIQNKNIKTLAGGERQTLDINSVISQFPIGVKILGKTTSELQEHLYRVLLTITQHQSTVTSRDTIGIRPRALLGMTSLVTSDYVEDTHSHERGLTDKPATIVRVMHDISNARVVIEYILHDGAVTRGIAPACRFPADTGTKNGWPDPGTITISGATAHFFTNDTQPSDYMFFDCWDFPDGDVSDSAAVARDCSCSDYAVIVFEENNPTVLNFTASVSSDGDITLTPAAQADYDGFDTTEVNIMIFDTWDNVEACQQMWLAFSDSTGTLGAGDDDGHRFV